MVSNGQSQQETQEHVAVREADGTAVRVQISIEESAQNLAEQTKQVRQRGEISFANRPRLLNRLRTQRLMLHNAYLLFVRLSETQEIHSYAAEWLLDNYYIVQQTLRQIDEDMPEKFYRQLPKLAGSRLAGLPRIYAIAMEFVRSSNAAIDTSSLERFIEAYQTVTPLTMGELWALPVMLRFSIIETLTQASVEVLDIQGFDESTPGSMLGALVSPDALVANSITSLRTLAIYDWKDFFEQSSLVDRALRTDPNGVYPLMDFATRDRYRKVVEKLALQSSVSEVEVAKVVVRLSFNDYTQNGSNPRSTHVGYYLIDHGRTQLEKHLGIHLTGVDRLMRWLRSRPTLAYLGSIGFVTLLFLVPFSLYALSQSASILMVILVGLLSIVPALTLAVDLVNWGVNRLIPPHILPRLDFQHSSQGKRKAGQPAGIPSESRTLIVIPALLTSLEEVEDLLRQLELHALRNTDRNLAFALLTDFSDSPEQTMPTDQAVLQRAVDGVQNLRERYQSKYGPGPFLLLHRERRWNPKENAWMGWERKRGKLEELNRLLSKQGPTSFTTIIGDLQALLPIRYVITLDADTLLPQGNAAALIGTMAHPLNEPHFDPRTGRIIAGYSILQPRTEILPSSQQQTNFTALYAGDSHFDLYTHAVSDVYQDLFGEGSYVGKGIYDVQAFQHSLEGQIPENTLLSHDLLEGLLGRAGLASDIVLYEEYPPNYQAFIRRINRWMRGDWQLLPWLFPRVDRGGIKSDHLDLIDRWKIFDNLRRSLVGPALLLLLVLGWLVLPGSPLFWTLGVLVTSSGPVLASAANRAFRRDKDERVEEISPPRQYALPRWLLFQIFLLFEALVSLSAMLTSLSRMFITQRKLLEWTPSAQTARLFSNARNAAFITWREMSESPLCALLIGAMLILFHPEALPVAGPFLLAWLVAPQVAVWLDNVPEHQQDKLADKDRQTLQLLARRTWFFFEQFTGPADHWLPPDHYQETPKGAIAHRTSPTNIGLGMLSTLAAYDFGYISPTELLLRLRNLMDTLGRMERYRGHFLNWYETRGLSPLTPRYISTVDSGNLAGSLIALRQGLRELSDQPVQSWALWDGLKDTLGVLSETLQAMTADSFTSELLKSLSAIQEVINAHQGKPEEWGALLTDIIQNRWPSFEHNLADLFRPVQSRSRTSPLADFDPGQIRSLRHWADRVRFALTQIQREQSELTPWLEAFHQVPSAITSDANLAHIWQDLRTAFTHPLRMDQVSQAMKVAQTTCASLRAGLENTDLLPADIQAADQWLTELLAVLDSAAQNVTMRLADRDAIVQLLDQYIQEMDFSFLYDPNHHVFHIGYNLDDQRMDSNYYDLLASEARIASLIAIARHDAPRNHWLYLSRPLTRLDGGMALLSWSGTMFEYLMPTLLLREYPGTLLNQSARSAVLWQIEYGREKEVPWGMSESGFYFFDVNQNYQYRAFGAPGLGFKRGLSEDLVITPYASLLALPFAPQAVLDNLRRMTEMHLLTDYGLYESVDYTPERLPLGWKFAIVKSFMAHHQGMIMLQISNFLQGNRMVERFHSSPLIESVDLLLQEQFPLDAPVERLAEPDEEAPSVVPIEPQAYTSTWHDPGGNAPPLVHHLSNGSYQLMVTSKGSGYSQWHDYSLTRWRADTTLDDWGTWLYIQDLTTGQFWTAGAQLVQPGEGHRLDVLFSPSGAEFNHAVNGLASQTRITISPEDDVEIRQVRLTNTSDRLRRVSITSYAEVVLADWGADRRHQAFAKMMVESDFDPDLSALIFHRRPRAANDPPIYLLHMLVRSGGPAWDRQRGPFSYESSRMNFLGRDHTARNPLALDPSGPGLTGTTGYVLDPVMALRQELLLPARTSIDLAFLTIAGDSRQKVISAARQYNHWNQVERVFQQSRYSAEIELRRLDITSASLERYQRLLSTLIYPQPGLRANPQVLSANTKGQPGLWAYGISGDYPIILLRIGEREEVALLRDLLQAHAFWRARGLMIDLVILSKELAGYAQEVHDRVTQLLIRTGNDSWLNRRGGIYLLRQASMSEEDQILLQFVARAILHSGASLPDQLQELQKMPIELPAFVPVGGEGNGLDPLPQVERPLDLVFDNGLGGFTPDGREYVIYLPAAQPVSRVAPAETSETRPVSRAGHVAIFPGQMAENGSQMAPRPTTPAPWINVIANPQAGFWVSQAGGGYTWAANSGENRLSPWSNDPVSDTPGDMLYLRDEETAKVWSPTPLPAGAEAAYLVRHGAGYTQFEHNSHGLRQHLRLFVPRHDPLKILHLRLENHWQRVRRITVTYYVDWVLGVNRDLMAPYILPEYDNEHNAILATNPYPVEFAGKVAFLASEREPHGLTANRAEFLGRSGSYRHPAGLARVGLSGQVTAGVDPCAAIQVHLDIQAGQSQELFFLLGQGEDRQSAFELIERYQTLEQVQAAFEEVTGFWDDLLGTVQVHTPKPTMDLMLNRWLLYQGLSCRLWGRSALYQSSGAYGFRDQLQDVMALVLSAPKIARDQILRSVRHQFEAGDVLHWWHPPSGRGVRTRMSDDLLWLPYVTAEYIFATGDLGVLDEAAPFLVADQLKDEEEDRYGEFPPTPQSYTVYEHCIRAIKRGSTAGPHGIPLIGAGDWNDGMNRVGIGGKGESIWLGWFLCAVLERFARICRLKQENSLADQYIRQAQELREALHAAGWDGEWYLRAFYDDGQPLGSHANQECQIDSIAQSWAVLSDSGQPERDRQAMEAVLRMLVKEDDKLIELFTPPFDVSPNDPGYIKAYPPGVRENGGQYTHAATWVVWAYTRIGLGNLAERLYDLLNPVNHAATPEQVQRYKVEPYVIAADVYSEPPFAGHGGWTWYTGSAGWMYRLGLEAILGLRRIGQQLVIDPCIPADWDTYTLTYRLDGQTIYNIRVENPDHVECGLGQVSLDGDPRADALIPLRADGKTHEVIVRLAKDGTRPSLQPEEILNRQTRTLDN